MKKKTLLTAFLFLFCSVGLPLNSSVLEAQTSEKAVKPETYYTPINGYFYQTNEFLYDSPDSMEAWIKLPISSFGGTILSSAHDSTFYMEVDIYGKLGFGWKSEAFHTFSDSTYIADDTWHHVALVRTDDCFTYYLDGKVEGIFEAESSAISSEIQLNIGASYTNQRNQFEGYIKQVTMYEGAISQDRIIHDMSTSNIVNDADDTKLLANWRLGDYWTERFVNNSFSTDLNMELHTFDKFVGADYSFGEYDYTFAIFPDIQIMTNFNPTRLNNQIQWLVDNKEELNVQFAMFLGDLSDYGQREYLYETAANAMSRLDNAIPYCFVPGNHDYDDNANTRSQVYFNTHFPYDKHKNLPGFGGVYQEGSMANSYYTFEVGDVKYLVLNLEYMPRLSVLRWANIVAEAHPDYRIIMGTHSYLSRTGKFSEGASVGNEGNGGKVIFNEFMVNHPNIFMGVGGHEDNDDAVSRIDYGLNGNKILSMICDVQVSKYHGDNVLDVFMLVHVNEKKKTMNFLYYSPMHGKVYNIQNQFQISFADPNNPAIGE